ncbi:hypothetical protein JB92DRAFT_3144367 [Gautieria morchelliformis]|nr:hypothetical protein JB92DRAFT_3144367 [Gautieria morchelliformis]
MPGERTGLLKCLLKSFRRRGGKNVIDTQCEHTDGIPSLTVTTGDSLTAEGGSTQGHASERKNDPKSLPRVLRDCHYELQSLAKKLETKNTLDNLQRFQQQLVVALSIDQAHIALEADDNQRRQDIYKWLAAPDYESKHAAGEREEHTGSWFLHGESFLEWKSKPKSFLWLHGKAGAGKTILCSTIRREISDRSKSDTSVAVAFFYFDFRSKDIEPPNLLCALIKKLYVQNAKAPAKTSDYLMKLFSDKENGQGSLSPEELKSTLKSIISAFENTYIILDALDECPDCCA